MWLLGTAGLRCTTSLTPHYTRLRNRALESGNRPPSYSLFSASVKGFFLNWMEENKLLCNKLDKHVSKNSTTIRKYVDVSPNCHCFFPPSMSHEQLLCDCVCLSEINGSEQCMWNLIFGFISFKKCLFHRLFEDLLCGQHWIVGETKEIGNRSTNHGSHTQSAAAAKLLQSCPTLCNPIDGSPPCSPVPGILQARTLQWVAISFSNVWKWKVKVKSLSRVRLLATPWTASPPGSYVHGISQTRVLEWGTIAFSKGSLVGYI